MYLEPSFPLKEGKVKLRSKYLKSIVFTWPVERSKYLVRSSKPLGYVEVTAAPVEALDLVRSSKPLGYVEVTAAPVEALAYFPPSIDQFRLWYRKQSCKWLLQPGCLGCQSPLSFHNIMVPPQIKWTRPSTCGLKVNWFALAKLACKSTKDLNTVSTQFARALSVHTSLTCFW